MNNPLLAETLVGLSAAARDLPGSAPGRSVHAATMWRWATSGCTARGGRRVVLETVSIGSRRFTSREAVHRFIEALSEAPPTATPPRTPAARRKASERAAKELDALGV
jgi:hypothetical protein